MSELASIIATIGFPIVSFFAAGWACKYVYDKERGSLDSAIAKLGELTEAVNKNSEAVNTLVKEMHNYDDEGD